MPAPTAALPPTAASQPLLRPVPTTALSRIPLVVSTVVVPACLQPGLARREHIAASGSYTETERTASTPMLCHLERGSCGYNQLVGIVDPSIVYKREENPPYDTEDILIHPAMIQPLSHLNQLVQAE